MTPTEIANEVQRLKDNVAMLKSHGIGWGNYESVEHAAFDLVNETLNMLYELALAVAPLVPPAPPTKET